MLRRHSRKKIYLLVYLPDPTNHVLHTGYLAQYEIDVFVTRDKSSTINFIRDNEVGALLMVHEDGQSDSLTFMRYIMQQYPDIQRILLSETVSMSMMEQAINKAHINYFLELPVDRDRMLEIIRKALKRYILVSRPAEVIDELTEYVKEFREKANTDALTKLLNRRSFDEILDRALDLFEKNKIPISLVMLDLDHFKRLNDTYGHEAGDHVLSEFSRILKKNVRMEDSVFRYGGEEFAMVAHGDSKDDILQFIERILHEVRTTKINYKGQQISLTCSAGIETIHESLSRSELIQRADAALYYAKNTGRDRVVCFEPHMLTKEK